MVLADDNFATIAQAVEEGRTVYDNLRKTILFIIPTNGGEGGVIIGAILLGAELPIAPLQILWVNLVTAVTLALTLAFEAPEGDLMECSPRPHNAIATGSPATVMGLALGGLAALLSAALLLEALWETRTRGAAGTAFKLPAPMVLLAVAWHAPAYPFETEQLPWLLVAATGLLALAVAVLALSLALRRQRPSDSP
jgi:magnesium-transporting ATPase (P-type)